MIFGSTEMVFKKRFPKPNLARKVFLGLALLFFSSFYCWSEAIFAEPEEFKNYDPYTSLRARTQEGESLLEKSLNFLVFPLALVKKGTDETLYLVEHHHIDDKVRWIYERITDYGIYPNLQYLINFADFGSGVDLDFVKLLGQKGRFPYLRAKSGVSWVQSEFFRTFAEVGVEKLEEKGPFGLFYFDYVKRPNEDFFGLGPDTSRGDSMRYKSESTTLEARLAYALGLKTDLIGKFAYRHVNIGNGEEGGNGLFDRSVAGGRGGEFLTFTAEFMRDHRDFPEDAHKGGLERFSLSYAEGIDGSKFRYFKYRGELARYFELFSERQVLGVRLVAEHNDEVDKRPIPFFDMARLGGYGVFPSLGDTHRGFRKNRFFGDSLFLMNLEYRYLVWQYRDFSVEAVIFWDEGQVFNEISTFQFKDFRASIGGGFRLKLLRRALFSFETARGGEGTQVYVRSLMPF